jgi:hypothetical protein
VEAFREAHKYIDKSAKCGGIDAIIKKSFPQPSLQGGKRVDIEVLMGKAFIPDSPSSKKGA